MNSDAQKFDQLKSAFLAIISHELRTPLTEILAAANMLGDGYWGELSPAQTKYLGIIHEAAEHMNALIDDLIDYAQIQAEVVEVRREPTALTDLLTMILEQHRPRAEKKGLSLVAELSPMAPLALDRGHMARVFSNLIINAINFTPSGGRVVVHTRQDAAAQYVDVADTGIGIPEEKQARLFESFYQVADPLTRSVGGLGIGLAYARRIVEAHGGRVTFASRPGEGSVFTVRLPAG